MWNKICICSFFWISIIKLCVNQVACNCENNYQFFLFVYQAFLSCINPIISWVNPVLACVYSIVWCVNSILKTEKKNFAGNVHLLQLVIKTRNNHFPEEIKDFRSVVLWVKSISHRMTIILFGFIISSTEFSPKNFEH